MVLLQQCEQLFRQIECSDIVDLHRVDDILQRLLVALHRHVSGDASVVDKE